MKQAQRFDRLKKYARDEVGRCMADLPDELRHYAAGIDVAFMKKPDRAMTADGIEPDLLGIFLGRALTDEYAGDIDVTPRIVLFLENLWEYSEGTMINYKQEVRITYLHELGHYLGLGEGELDSRGLT